MKTLRISIFKDTKTCRVIKEFEMLYCCKSIINRFFKGRLDNIKHRAIVQFVEVFNVC